MSSLLDIVPTKAALLKKSKEFKVTVFEDPSKKIKPEERKPAPEESTPKDDDDDSFDEEIFGDRPPAKKPKADPTEFDIKKARHEVINLALSGGFRNMKHKKKSEIHLAVKLGAKPPKKPHRNYKELVEEKKRLKNIREERKKYHQLGKTQTGLASVKCKSKTQKEKDKKERAPVSNIGNHYGVANPKIKGGKRRK